MENKNRSDRRRFIARFVKVTAGVTLLGSGIKLYAKTNAPEDYTYCCFYCSNQNCPNFMKSCNGCRSDKISDYAKSCEVRNCCIGKGLISCGLCTELATCNKTLWINYPTLHATALRYQAAWMVSDIEQVKGRNHFIYPNPATDILNIQLTEMNCSSYRIISVNGALIKNDLINNAATSIDISNISSGEYIIQMLDQQKIIYTDRFLKE